MEKIPGETFAIAQSQGEKLTLMDEAQRWEVEEKRVDPGKKMKKKKSKKAKKGYSTLRMTGEDRREFSSQAEKTRGERNHRIVRELIDAWNKSVDDGVHNLHMRDVIRNTEDTLDKMRNDYSDKCSLSDLQKRKKEVEDCIDLCYKHDFKMRTVNEAIRQWNTFVDRMHQVGRENLKHCAVDIDACDQAVEWLVESWKTMSEHKIDAMIAVMDSLLLQLYPQLRIVEIFVEILVVRDRISEIPASETSNAQTIECNRIHARNLELLESVFEHHGQVTEAEARVQLDDYKLLERDVLRRQKAKPVNEAIRRWSTFAGRMHKVGVTNLKHCIADINACEQVVDGLNEWKTVPQDRINAMIAEMDCRLKLLYPQLRTMEIFAEITVVRDRISEIAASKATRTQVAEYDRIAARNVGLLEALQYALVTEVDAQILLDDIKLLERDMLSTKAGRSKRWRLGTKR